MKKILILFFMLVHSYVFADSISLIISGKPGGTFHTRSMLMHDALVELGYDVNLVNAGNLSVSAQIFNTTSDPVIMPWIDSANVKENLQPDATTWGILEYRSPIIFCSKKYKDFNNNKITIGYSASWPSQIFDNLQYASQKEVKSIPYRNSGDLVLSLISDDVDYVAISLSQMNQMPQNSCFAVTNREPVQGIDPLDKLLPNFDYNYINQHAYWLQKNTDVDIVRSLLLDAIKTPAYKDWIQSQLFLSDFALHDDDLSLSQHGAYDWGLK